MTWLYVSVLGAAGSLARYALGGLLGAHAWLPTLVVNLLGSLGIGLAIGLMGQVTAPRGVGITAGFFGGFTTYSAFAYQTVALAEKRAYGVIAAYVGLTLVGCFAACAAGLAAGRTLAR